MVSALKQLKQDLSKSRVARVGKKSSVKKLQINAEQRKKGKNDLRAMAENNRTNNPFLMKFTKQKHDILGRKTKGVLGNPSATRKRGELNRERTLAVELKSKSRTSVLVDRRFGENDLTMTTEDKMLMRLMKEKTVGHERSSANFNLQDETELTHMGQSLSNIDAFDEAGLELMDNGDDSDNGNIDESIVKYTHFGGFDDPNDKDPNARKSRNEIMKEVMAKSKQHKRERQAQKEVDLNITEEVDRELDDIREFLAPMKPSTEGKMVIAGDRLALINSTGGPVDLEPAPRERRKKQDEYVEFQEPELDIAYDKAVRALAYDRRSKPTDRTKSAEEVAAYQAAELNKLEASRVARMTGTPVEEPTGKLSKREKYELAKKTKTNEADDLGDDDFASFNKQAALNNEVQPLTYKDGVLVNKEIFMSKPEVSSGDEGSESEGSQSESGDEDEDLSGSDEESKSGSLEATVVESGTENFEKTELNNEEESNTEGLSAGEIAECNDEDDDDLSIMEVSGEEIEEIQYDSDMNEEETSKIIDAEINERQKASAELPFVFEAPETYDDLMSLFEDRSFADQNTIIERLIVLYNPKISNEMGKKLEGVMMLLLQYLELYTYESQIEMAHVRNLELHCVKLARFFPLSFGNFSKQKILYMRDQLNKSLMGGKGCNMPDISGLIFFKIIANVYSTSDLKHPIATPALLLLSQYLSHGTFNNIRDVLSGLFISHLICEYTRQSHRFVPELYNFLTNIVILSMRNVADLKLPLNIPTFSARVLLPIVDFSAEPASLNFHTIFATNELEESNELNVSILVQSFQLLATPNVQVSSAIEVNESCLMLLRQVPHLKMHLSARRRMDAVAKRILDSVERATSVRQPLQMQKRKAMEIRSFMPKFVANYSADKRYDHDKDRAKTAKDKAEYKKEFKGAVRELRKDGQFIRRANAAERKEKDGQYKKKIDKILGGLANEEGSMRGYERRAKRGKTTE